MIKSFATTAVELWLQYRTLHETGIQFRGMNFYLHSLRPHIFRLSILTRAPFAIEREWKKERKKERGSLIRWEDTGWNCMLLRESCWGRPTWNETLFSTGISCTYRDYIIRRARAPAATEGDSLPVGYFRAIPGPLTGPCDSPSAANLLTKVIRARIVNELFRGDCVRLAVVVTGDNWPSLTARIMTSEFPSENLSFDGKWNSAERLLVLVDIRDNNAYRTRARARVRSRLTRLPRKSNAWRMFCNRGDI